MTTTPSTAARIEVERVAGNIGAEIRGVDLAGPVDDELAERLLDELTRHKVLFFRGQRLDDDSQVAFTARLGPLTTAHPTVPGRRANARVLDVDGRTLRVSGLDAVDGTPVLDIKPYMAEFGPRGDIDQPAWAGELMRQYWTTA